MITLKIALATVLALGIAALVLGWVARAKGKLP